MLWIWLWKVITPGFIVELSLVRFLTSELDVDQLLLNNFITGFIVLCMV